MLRISVLIAEEDTMTPSPRQNDRLDQAFLRYPLAEPGVSAWIENSEISYNIRRFYTMPVVQTGFRKARSLFVQNGGMLPDQNKMIQLDG